MGEDNQIKGHMRGVPRLVLAATLGALALAGCTTLEGTNAFTNPVAFERQVLCPTLHGLSLADPCEEAPPVPTGDRQPLNTNLPAGYAPPPPAAAQ